MLGTVTIKNYKSIKDLTLECKRINLFIGRPNVGKSNLLEAISLLDSHSGIGNPEYIRKENFRNLFFDQEINNIIEVDDGDYGVRIFYNPSHSSDYSFNIIKHNNINSISNGESLLTSKLSFLVRQSLTHTNSTYYQYNNKGGGSKEDQIIEYKKVVKPYLFKKINNQKIYNENQFLPLSSPFGENIFTVLKNNKPLLKEIAELFKEYGYDLVIDSITDQAEIQKNDQGIVYKVPFSLVADTLQRIIFHKCAIRSNLNSTILFEEPENHSFPPYIKELAQEMIDSETNQFFVATHSPYLFDTIVSEAKAEEVAIHIVSFEDYQTKVKLLSKQDIADISNHGIDVFFNLDMFA